MRTMTRLARIGFGVGSLAFVFIGGLHSYVHFDELSGTELARRFDAIGPIALQGGHHSGWDLFQGTSLLMGLFSAALGLVLLCTLATTPRNALPHWSICAVICLTLVGVMIVGGLYLSQFQVIGGAFGLICFGLPIFAGRLPEQKGDPKY